MIELQFTSNEGDGFRVFPSIQLQERSIPLASGDDLQLLSQRLCAVSRNQHSMNHSACCDSLRFDWRVF